MRNWFAFRFLYGTSRWDTGVLLLLLVCYLAVARWLYAAHVGAVANSVLLGGCVLLLFIGVMLYYGARQAAISRELDAETLRADAEHRLTGKLQEALLQQPLPAISNMAFSATYVPAATRSLVGGDWYDAFELPHGRVMFSIGDVAGHGIEAAVIMSRARQAIISAALLDSDPGSVLARANETLMLHGTTFATAICGYIDPGTLEVTYATAGHPPGILVDKSGVARLLQYDGIPLGIEHGSAYPTFRITASHESLLVLYTDGLLEYDRDLIEGERRMLQAAENIAAQRVADPAGAIEDAIFKTHKPLDDVAILTIAFRDWSVHAANTDPSERWSIGLRGIRTPYGASGDSIRTETGLFKWRMGWDSNPRNVHHVRKFSRLLPSTARPPIRRLLDLAPGYRAPPSTAPQSKRAKIRNARRHRRPKRCTKRNRPRHNPQGGRPGERCSSSRITVVWMGAMLL